MSLEQWALPKIAAILPLDDEALKQIITYTSSLPNAEGRAHLGGILGDSAEAKDFIAAFGERTSQGSHAPASQADEPRTFAPPPGPPPSHAKSLSSNQDVKQALAPPGPIQDAARNGSAGQDLPPSYAPPPNPPQARAVSTYHHSNQVIEAAKLRAVDEQDMQQALQNVQYQFGIYNSDIEPEHDSDYPCNCAIHRYKSRKWARYRVQEIWAKAVMYPGEKYYDDNQYAGNLNVFSGSPYRFKVVSPYGYNQITWGGPARPVPSYHAKSIHQTIALNHSLNEQAQANVDAKEPDHDIWSDNALETALSKMAVSDSKRPVEKDIKGRSEKAPAEKRQSLVPSAADSAADRPKGSRFSTFRQSIGIKSSEERSVAKVSKAVNKGETLRGDILSEESGRWPDEQWRYIVAVYQEKVGMSAKIADLRVRHPIEYLHLLRAGYFEPIPVAWASQASNPLKFTIEAAAGWRGLTPKWRGFEDTAEERLYWVLNHREGSVGMRMKPDFISEMNMALARMASAVDPPPAYFSADDTCHLQHTSEGYSKQVMPPPFRAYDRPENANDDTMILLDVSGSMDFEPVRPVYDQYLITRYVKSTQPKNKDVAKAVIRRFTDAMANHDHQFGGYDLTTFSSQATYIGSVNHRNLDQMWSKVRLGGGTRVMTGWQKVKDLHFHKHSESATYHPVYGWQAGPQTPMLRLLLLLDGEATDMDEFELDLLGLSWAHVTIFLIGVDGCPHHHRHANELQRISDVNHHVSFVDAQGNTPERFVTHELLKRHLGYEMPVQEFVQLEELPPYVE